MNLPDIHNPLLMAVSEVLKIVYLQSVLREPEDRTSNTTQQAEMAKRKVYQDTEPELLPY